MRGRMGGGEATLRSKSYLLGALGEEGDGAELVPVEPLVLGGVVVVLAQGGGGSAGHEGTGEEELHSHVFCFVLSLPVMCGW
jgi:hypothetical protein